MKEGIYTSFEGDYHLGVAALINSAIRSGFAGEFHVFFRGDLPPWVSTLEGEGDLGFRICSRRLQFHREAPGRHFGYDKPRQARRLFERDLELEALYYFDPDVVILCPWKFFQRWVHSGVALMLDINFPVVPRNHPWREEWKILAPDKSDNHRSHDQQFYPNSGFFGMLRKEVCFLEAWCATTDRFEEMGGDTMSFRLEERWRAVTGDQDLLAATLMAWSGPVSTVGPEGMGFTGHYFLLSHATEKPKPWGRNCIWYALRGAPPRRTVSFFLENSKAPIRAFSDRTLAQRKVFYRIARIVGSFWHKPTD